MTAITGVDGTGNTELVLPESGELVTKEYADLKVALASFIGTNQSLSGSGYQKLPGGLIIQWGRSASTVSTGQKINLIYPISFTSEVFVAVGQTVWGASTIYPYISSSPSLTQIELHNTSSVPQIVRYFVIGH